MSASKRKRFESPAAALKALQIKTGSDRGEDPEDGEADGSLDFR